mgnify:CR=1 FL=1
MIEAALAAGVVNFGENRVQEAERKIRSLRERGLKDLQWHLIGHLQSNKARKAVQLFEVVQSVDSIDLARRLDRICREEDRKCLPVFLQVDLAGETTKSGVAENELMVLADHLSMSERLRFDGLMLIPPYFENAEHARPFFRRLRELRDHLAEQDAFNGRLGELSMGMSHDLEVAVEEGATLVRVGTAIFGERQ